MVPLREAVQDRWKEREMTTARELVFDRIDQVDGRIDGLIKTVEANVNLGVYVGRSVENTIPSLIEMIGEITKAIDNDELTEIIAAKLAVMKLEQDRFSS